MLTYYRRQGVNAMGEFGPSGGPGGSFSFDQVLLAMDPAVPGQLLDIHITKVDIWWGAEINSIKAYYIDSTGNTYTGTRYGTSGGSNMDTYVVPQNEFLTGIKGQSGHRVDAITFMTRNTNSMGYGSGGGGRDYLYTVEFGFEIVGFKVWSGDSIDAIGIYTRQHRI
jgi:Jacalin-like lectin domain